jgi:hypothetical protein
MSDAQRVIRLASLLEIAYDRLCRQIVGPLPLPLSQSLRGWIVPEISESLLAITDGFALFGSRPSECFRLWGSAHYAECRRYGGPISGQSAEEMLFPVFGDIPHLTSISIPDGTVVATDWEVHGRPEQGWHKVIAKDLKEYIRTVIEVREAYGDGEESPSDWWHPYASRGTRLDLSE